MIVGIYCFYIGRMVFRGRDWVRKYGWMDGWMEGWAIIELCSALATSYMEAGCVLIGMKGRYRFNKSD